MQVREQKQQASVDPCDASNTVTLGDVAAALEAIKRIHGEGGTPLAKPEAIDVHTRFVFMGFPEPISKARGRKPAQVPTQYDMARKRRQDKFRRLVVLPALRKGKGYIDHADVKRRLEACRAQGIPRHKWVAKVCGDLARDGKPCVERTIRRVKKAWEAR